MPIFGSDDEYDCDCQRRYCEMVWSCAGGRGQGWLGHEFNCHMNCKRRNRMLRQGMQCPSNNFKCPKVSNNPNARGPGDRYREGGYYDQRMRPGEQAGDTIYGGLGDPDYEEIPAPADIPLPMVDES